MRRPSAVTGALVVVVLSLMGNIATNTVKIPDRWVPVVWVVTILLAIANFFIERRNRVGGLGVDELEEAAARLAMSVKVEWDTEWERRGLHDPFPLPVRWRNAPHVLMDHSANVHLTPAGVTPEPLDLTGQLDRIVEVYQLVSSRRLVILGRAGSGKTILAIRFVLDLLAAPIVANDPVPVIFSIGSWNPVTTSFRNWLADQLIRDHPGLATPGPTGVASLAAALIRAGRILPVLDGFDEIATGLRRAALIALNATNMPLLVTSRTDEYADAVAGTDVLTSAAGIELTDLTLSDLVNYLPRTIHRATRIGTITVPVWNPVLDEMRDHPHSPASVNLTAVLTTPLMVALARAIYSDTPAYDPSALLDTSRFTTRQAVEDHLLGTFISKAYEHKPADQQRWNPDRVHHWLGYLGYLAQHGGGDLAWWQLGDTMRRSSRMLLVGIVTGLGIGLLELLVGALVIMRGHGLGDWLSFGLMDAFLVGLPAGLAFGLAHELMVKFGGGAIEPSRVRIQIFGETRGTRKRVVSRFGVGFVGGLGLGLVIGFVAGLVKAKGYNYGLMDVLWTAFLDAILEGSAFGIGAGLVAGLTAWLETPLDIRSVTKPSDLLRTNRANVIFGLLVSAPLFGLIVALLGWLMVGLLQEFLVAPPYAIGYEFRLGLQWGLMGAFGGGLGYLFSLTTWGQWVLLARLWLPLTGRLPWAVLTFLDDACEQGVLRRAGAVYQFRHARLRDHLAQSFHGDLGRARVGDKKSAPELGE